MAVYRRQYRPYEGALTADWSRPLVLTRYALEGLFAARVTIGLLSSCLIWPIVAAILIYLHHNLDAILALNINVSRLVPIDNTFFYLFLTIQGTFAFLLAAYVGPGLIAPDLANQALPLYLCRPITRAGYVLGKLMVLFVPLSLVTWVPGLLLFVMQGSLAGPGWMLDNARIAGAILAGSLLWIGVLGLLSLSLSAWVKWRMAAGALLFGIFFVMAGMANVINEVMETRWGYLVDLGHLIGVVWMHLFAADTRDTIWGELFNVTPERALPLSAVCIMLAVLGGLCILLLNRRLRAKEVA